MTPYVGLAGGTVPELFVIEIFPVRVDDLPTDKFRGGTTIGAK